MKNSEKIGKLAASVVLIIIGILLFSTIALGMHNKNAYLLDNSVSNKTQFFAIIEFTLYEGEGCGCDHLQDILIFADGLDTDHDELAYTDDDGYCLMELEIDASYRISIQDEDYQNILFDFIVVDDQTFTFHLIKEEVSRSHELTDSGRNIPQPEHISLEVK